MGFVPSNARWYLAEAILEHTIEGDPRNVIHLNTHLIEADGPELAYRKAVSLGRESEIEYPNTEGKLVRINYRGLRRLDVIHDDLADGAELFYEEHVAVAEDQIERWVKTPEALAVFAPTEGKRSTPNLMPEEIARELEKFGIPRDAGFDDSE